MKHDEEGETFMKKDADVDDTRNILNGLPDERKKNQNIETQMGNNSTALFVDKRLLLISIIITLFIV